MIKFSVYGENHHPKFDPERWSDDPLDHRQISATFAGTPFNDGTLEEAGGLPKVIYCPAKALMQGFALAFLQNIVSSLNWQIQNLPGQAPPLPLLLAYPMGLRGYASKRDVSLPVSVPISHYTTRTITPGSKVIVVGGGIGGLVAAYELQKRGCKVTVLEAAGEIGAGKCECLEIDGYLYNVGAHIVRLDGHVKNLAEQVGIEIEPYTGKHQKYKSESGTKKQTDKIELIESESQIKAILEHMDTHKFGFVGLNDHAATIRRWHNQAKPLVDLVYPLFYGAGYGQAKKMSAAYLMRFAEASQHSIQSDNQTGTPKGGFGGLLRALAKNLDIRCNARVVAVDRTANKITVELANKTQYEGDHLFVACNRPNAFLKGDDQESELLDQIRYLPYMTGMIKADGLNKDGFCVTDDPEKQSPVASYTYYHRDTNVLTWWGYAKPGQSDNDFLEASLLKLKSMGANFPDGEKPIFYSVGTICLM
ncbi:FAD-dependent oxidoreductase [Algoriphagus halophilus]|uniref:FAD-dependent oxidoreductase n=1 Tax=Algoriphagus halophilus TaxID=226505 RepID=UPI00358ECB67